MTDYNHKLISMAYATTAVNLSMIYQTIIPYTQ